MGRMAPKLAYLGWTATEVTPVAPKLRSSKKRKNPPLKLPYPNFTQVYPAESAARGPGAGALGAAKAASVRCCQSRVRAVLPKPRPRRAAKAASARCCQSRVCAVLPMPRPRGAANA